MYVPEHGLWLHQLCSSDLDEMPLLSDDFEKYEQTMRWLKNVLLRNFDKNISVSISFFFADVLVEKTLGCMSLYKLREGSVKRARVLNCDACRDKRRVMVSSGVHG